MSSSRREFLKAAGAAAPSSAASGLPAYVQAAPATPWDAVPVILARIKPPTFAARDFAVTSYGGKGDGRSDNTKAFRDAILACNKAGGGRVVVPKGTFLTGPIHLLSDVNLHVEAGATIRFSTDRKKYLPIVFTRWQGIECYNWSPFIYGHGLTNVAITGQGHARRPGRLVEAAGQRRFELAVVAADGGGQPAGRAAAVRRRAHPAAQHDPALPVHERADRGREDRQASDVDDPPGAVDERHRARRHRAEP